MSKARISGHYLIAGIAVLLVGASCEKKNGKPSDTGALGAIDRAGSAGPVDTTPLQGIELGKLDGDKQKLFYKLIGSLGSPCGKPESLRKSYASDTSCKRAPFAVRYVIALLEDEQTEEVARDEYKRKYEAQGKVVKLDVAKAPRVGNDDAPIRLVEFFDYACPHCAQFRPMLDRVAADHAGKVVEYFLMFPLGKWQHSKSAAQASLAAAQQGKFKEMHELLFAKAPLHDKESVTGYAKQVGLDMAKFEADYTAAATQVELDRTQGESAGVESTPVLFFNERRYEGPLNPRYIGMWIEEELAVNR